MSRNRRKTCALPYIFFGIIIYATIIGTYLYFIVFPSNIIITKYSMLNQYMRGAPRYEFSFILRAVNNWEVGETMLPQIDMMNEEQKVYNLDIFGPVTEATNVIVVQVHTRIEYLKVLVDQLSKVKGIEDALVIFSHDVFLPQVNENIQRINFTRIMQIFYPYSIQTYPDKFPGPSGTDKVHKRDARMSQIKLHWWWKVNFVFEQLRLLKNFKGVISFTEDDTYFTENALWMLDLMKVVMIRNQCEGCQILSLAENGRLQVLRGIRYENILRKSGNTSEMEYSKGILYEKLPSIHFAFNRTVWNKLKGCSKEFCSYNDYNWDWTVRKMFKNPKCMPEPVKTLGLIWPRVFHIGDCGHHHFTSNGDCNPTRLTGVAFNTSELYAKLWPKRLEEIIVDEEEKWKGGEKLEDKEKLHKGFGGFSDPRDIRLCELIGSESNASRLDVDSLSDVGLGQGETS